VSGLRLFVASLAVLAGWGGTPALAQPEDLNRGKTPAQLFASDCADCHRNPRGLAKSDARSLAGFLRVHYTASKESAAAIAEYLAALAADPRGGPARPAAPRPAPSAAKPAATPTAAAPAAKPAEGSPPKPPEAAGEAKPAETPAAAPAAPAAAPPAPPAANPQ